jgi:hypothetical protein
MAQLPCDLVVAISHSFIRLFQPYILRRTPYLYKLLPWERCDKGYRTISGAETVDMHPSRIRPQASLPVVPRKQNRCSDLADLNARLIHDRLTHLVTSLENGDW